MAETTEASVRDDVEGKKPKDKHSQEKRDADDQQDPLPNSIPLAKCNVWHKDDGSGYSKQQPSCVKEHERKRERESRHAPTHTI